MTSMQTDVESVARALTKAQRDALLAAQCVKVGPYPERWEVQTPRVWKSLIDKGLAYGDRAQIVWRHRPNDRAVLNSTGLAVRAHLKGNQNGN